MVELAGGPREHGGGEKRRSTPGGPATGGEDGTEHEKAGGAEQ